MDEGFGVLPPLVEEIADGSISWKWLEGPDFEVVGYFLSCHLVIEHYIDEYLKLRYSTLDWDAARLTFNQKLSLLSCLKVCDNDFIPLLKHLNSLRNKVGHNIDFKLEAADLLPLTQHLTKLDEELYELLHDGDRNGYISTVRTEPKAILSRFTRLTCRWFAGGMTVIALMNKQKNVPGL